MEQPNVALAVRYHHAVAGGATGAELAEFLHPDVVQHEWPNALLPDGAERDLAAMCAAAERGQQVLREQRFEIVGAVADGNRVALETVWTGTLAIAAGDLPAGHVLRARIATFLEFRAGKIIAQRNYDCYERG
jgi:ketosteroid isomerase-like protein